jgi:hypothetical protein
MIPYYQDPDEDLELRPEVEAKLIKSLETPDSAMLSSDEAWHRTGGTMTTVQERVQAGVAFLNEHQPGWSKRISLAELDLSNCDRCVLGQVFGSFEQGLETLDLGYLLARNLGFNSDGAYRKLTNAWVEAIMALEAAP